MSNAPTRNWRPIRRGFSCGRLPPAMFRDWRGLSLGSCRSPKVTSVRCLTRFPQSSPDATSRSASFSRNDFRQLREVVSLDQDLSEQRQLLIGAYFVSEFSVESAALFNPSMVADPDQQGLPPGALRFVLSLRATGDGSISSIVFRTGIIHADHRIEVRPAACCIVEPSRIPNALYEKPLFERKILELGLTNEHTRRVMERLGDSFTEQELQSTIETELKECSTPEGAKDRQDTAQRMSIAGQVQLLSSVFNRTGRIRTGYFSSDSLAAERHRRRPVRPFPK